LEDFAESANDGQLLREAFRVGVAYHLFGVTQDQVTISDIASSKRRSTHESTVFVSFRVATVSFEHATSVAQILYEKANDQSPNGLAAQIMAHSLAQGKNISISTLMQESPLLITYNPGIKGDDSTALSAITVSIIISVSCFIVIVTVLAVFMKKCFASCNGTAVFEHEEKSECLSPSTVMVTVNSSDTVDFSDTVDNRVGDEANNMATPEDTAHGKSTIEMASNMDDLVGDHQWSTNSGAVVGQQNMPQSLPISLQLEHCQHNNTFMRAQTSQYSQLQLNEAILSAQYEIRCDSEVGIFVNMPILKATKTQI